MKTVTFWLAFIIAIPSALVAQEKPEVLSMAYYQRRAANNQALLEELKASTDIAEAKQYRAKWAFGPKLVSDTAFAPVPAEADPDEFGENLDEIFALNIGPFVRQSFKVVVPIYTFGRVRVAQELAAVGVDVEALKTQQAREDAAFQATRAYRGLQLSAAYRDLLSDGSKIIKEKLAEIEEEREFGQSTVDVKDLRKVQIFDAEVDGLLLENDKLKNIADAGLRFLADTEQTVLVGAITEKTELPTLEPLAHYQTVATQNRPEILMLQKAGLAAGLAKKLAHRNWYPNIVLGSELSMGWSTESVAPSRVCREIRGECVDTSDLFARPSSNPLNFLSFTIGLAMRWEFDYWQLRGKSREADAVNRRTGAQATRAVKAIGFEVETLWSKASEAHKRVEVTERRLTAARRWRDQFGLKMETGGADLKDSVDPLRAYFESKALHLEARFDYLVAHAALTKGTGVSLIPASE